MCIISHLPILLMAYKLVLFEYRVLSAQALSDIVAEAQAAMEYMNETPGLVDPKKQHQAAFQPEAVSWKWDILRPVVPGPE